jgi:hypothetical protein
MAALTSPLHRTASLLFSATLLVALGACSDDDTSSGSNGPTLLPDGGGGTANPDLTACADNLDCGGGEVCRDGLCRAACADDDECDGLTPICDPAAGFCVGCRVTGDCAGGERCRAGLCEPFCRSAEDCGQGEACQVSTGACMEAECEANRDCRGGEACRGGLCRPIDEPICTPGATRCSGSTLITCTADGRREVESTCSGRERCEDTGTSARCIDPSCEPFSIGCIDDATAFVCAAAGDDRDLLPCRGDQRCVDGSCVRRACTPGTFECDGNAVRVCNEDGSAFVLVVCDGLEECADTPWGCTCNDGTCAARICDPGTAECVGPGSRSCLNDGRTLGPVEACADDEGCFGGQCEPIACTPGTVRCSGTSLLTCTVDGAGYSVRDCRSEGAFCDTGAPTPTCTTRTCEPGLATCNATNTAVIVCNATGSEQTTTACGTNEYCSAGRCLERVCTPGARSCRSGNVHVCNALGSGFTLIETCNYGSVDTSEDCGAQGKTCSVSAQACVGGDTSTCRTDAECVALAGSDPEADKARCDSRVGCVIPGLCGSAGALVIDPFNSPCLAGQTCELDLLGSIFGNEVSATCGPCSTEDASTCRAGEVCRASLLGSATCRRPSSDSGGGLPPIPGF